MNVKLFKLLTSIGLWLVALGCGLVPLLIRNFNTNKLAISLSQCFAGGLFISIGLIHILPEARENLEDSWKKEGEDAFPLSYFICLVTFSMILLIDKVLFNNSDIIEGNEPSGDLRTSLVRKSFLGKHDNDPQENFQEMVSHNMKIALSMSRLNLDKNKERDEEDSEEYLEIPSEQLPQQQGGTLMDGKALEGNANIKMEEAGQSKKLEVLNLTDSQKIAINADKHDHHDHGHGHGHHEHKGKLAHSSQKIPDHDHTHGVDDHHGHHHATVSKGASYMSAMVILTAMGIHGLFEGLAYGVSSTEEEVLNMFIAIAAHKWCDSLVVGISFVAAELPFKMALSLTVFLSFFTPMGILFGYLASENKVITGVFQALSAGTFLYISCAEIIIEEFAIADKKFWKFLMYTLGILFIVVMGQLEH